MQTKLDQSLYYIIGNSFLRIIGAHQEDSGAFDRLKKMRPRPSNYVAWGSTEAIKAAYKKAKEMQMLKRDTRSRSQGQLLPGHSQTVVDTFRLLQK